MTMQQKKGVISFMLIAFLWSAVLPLFASYAPPRESDVFGGQMLICTAQGFKWVSVSDVPDNGGSKQQHHLKCALCYFHKHYVVDWQIASHSLDVGYPQRLATFVPAADEALRQTAPPYLLLPSRAPPLAV